MSASALRTPSQLPRPVYRRPAAPSSTAAAASAAAAPTNASQPAPPPSPPPLQQQQQQQQSDAEVLAQLAARDGPVSDEDLVGLAMQRIGLLQSELLKKQAGAQSPTSASRTASRLTAPPRRLGKLDLGKPTVATKPKEAEPTAAPVPARFRCRAVINAPPGDKGVRCMVLSQNHIWGASRDGLTIVIRHVKTGQLVRTLRHPDEDKPRKPNQEKPRLEIASLAVSADGATVWSGSLTGVIRLWDATTFEHLKAFKAHSGQIEQLVTDRDGHVWSASADFTVKQWNGRSHYLMLTLNGHSNWVRCVVPMPELQTVWSGSDDNTLRVWDSKTGQQLMEIVVGDGVCAALNVDGTVWCGLRTRAIHVYDAATRELLATLEGHTGWVNCLALVGDQVWSGSSDQTLRVWDARTRSPIQQITDFRGWIYSIATAGDLLWASCSDRKIRLFGVEGAARPAPAPATPTTAPTSAFAAGNRRDAAVQTEGGEADGLQWLDDPNGVLDLDVVVLDSTPDDLMPAAAAGPALAELEAELAAKTAQLSDAQTSLAEARAALALRERQQGSVSALEDKCRQLERANASLVLDCQTLAQQLAAARKEVHAAEARAFAAAEAAAAAAEAQAAAEVAAAAARAPPPLLPAEAQTDPVDVRPLVTVVEAAAQTDELPLQVEADVQTEPEAGRVVVEAATETDPPSPLVDADAQTEVDEAENARSVVVEAAAQTERGDVEPDVVEAAAQTEPPPPTAEADAQTAPGDIEATAADAAAQTDAPPPGLDAEVQTGEGGADGTAAESATQTDPVVVADDEAQTDAMATAEAGEQTDPAVVVDEEEEEEEEWTCPECGIILPGSLRDGHPELCPGPAKGEPEADDAAAPPTAELIESKQAQVGERIGGRRVTEAKRVC